MLAASIGGIAVGRQQQWDMDVVCVFRQVKHDVDLWEERRFRLHPMGFCVIHAYDAPRFFFCGCTMLVPLSNAKRYMPVEISAGSSD